jgi:hypothetical protein
LKGPLLRGGAVPQTSIFTLRDIRHMLFSGLIQFRLWCGARDFIEQAREAASPAKAAFATTAVPVSVALHARRP